MQPQRVNPVHVEARAGSVLFDIRHLGQPAAGEDLIHDEFEELQVPHRDWHPARGEFLVARQNDGVQQHPPSAGNAW